MMKKLLLTICILTVSFMGALGQSSSIKLKVKEGPNPDIYIDGKKYDYAIMDLLDQSKIASVNVLKGEMAMKEYNAPNGVVLITTKSGGEIKIKSKGSKELKLADNPDKDPKIIVDGKVMSKEQLSKLAPDEIDNINVVKGEKALSEYNAPNGVIIVETKLGKKKN
ncbi:hypothetical protein SAMN06298216_3097 [Spirosomataceae bacterium TFI 002]|nr:hypothetical protein SAMN06298216_3097 [Spirosomataceae bacterium TFI 002]